MKAKLVVVGGEAKIAEIDLKLPTIIGRGRDVALTLPHPLVSREHCEIYESDGRLFVRDLGSLNGTFINNQRIEGEAELPVGDLLTIGTVTFRADYEDQPDLRPPAAGGQNPTVRAPADATVPAARATRLDDDSTQEAPEPSQVDEELADEDFEGFEDLDVDDLEVDELDVVDESAEQTIENQPADAVPLAGPASPAAESLPLPEPTPPTALTEPSPTSAVPVAPTPSPSSPPLAQQLPRPTPPEDQQPDVQTPSLPIADPQEDDDVKDNDDGLSTFLKGLK